MSEIYTEHYTTLNHDTDAKGIVRPSCIQRYMQETANHQMRDCKPTYEELFNEGKAFILSRMTVSYTQPIGQYENIDVQTWPSSKDRGATFTRCYIVSAEGKEVARAVGIWALVDIETKKLLRVGDCDMTSYTHAEPFEMKEMRFRVPSEALDNAGSFRVGYSFCDCNMHMNNTHYPDMFCNFIPNVHSATVKGYSLTYRREARLGDILDIKKSLPHEDDDGSITYYFRSFVGEEINAEARITVIRDVYEKNDG